VPFRLVHKLEEDVVDGTPDERSEVEEFAVDSMQRRLQEVSLSWVLAVEQLEQLRVSLERENTFLLADLKNKALIDVSLADVCVELGALDEAQEELIDDLQVRPCKLQNRLILLWVERVARWVHLRRYRTEQIG
jgi:hypothetical protein